MSKKRIDLAPNVSAFLESSTECVGNALSDWYNIGAWDSCTQGEIASPIEQLFYMGFQAIILTSGIDKILDCQNKQINISPQEKIGKYRVDFLLSYVHLGKQITYKEAVIELDGHDFHDKDERQRRYEKQRDRFLQAQEYRIFHFTGKEVTDDPYKPACEVLAYLTEHETAGELYPINYI